jgi:hypothetical protein
MNKKFNWLVYLLILFPALLFFWRLFIPNIKLFYTPDFGRSDLWHFNYPMKHFLGESLKRAELPLWSREVGNGFPFFAESQIGALNIFNLILFAIFKTPLAINLSYFVTFIFSTLGCYLLGRELNLSKLGSIFMGVVFTFSGFFVAHIPHLNLIQAASFLPWLLLINIKLIKHQQVKHLLIFSFLLAQQLFYGHSQITFISLFTLLIYNIGYIRKKKNKEKLNLFLLLTTGVIIGFLLAAVQLLPTMQLKQYSLRKSGLSYDVSTQHVYPYKHLITFLNPFLLGSPVNGSYYENFNFIHYIFWENTAYLGIIPLLAFMLSFFQKKKKNSELKPFLLVIISAFILIFGKNSPLYFLFSLPPFNWFRVPSRFLLPLTLGVSLIASGAIENSIKSNIKKQKLRRSIFVLILILATADLFLNFYNYHPLVDKDKALQPPASAEYLKTRINGRIFHDQVGFSSQWNDSFFSQGWKNIDPYLYAKNSLDGDLNMVYNIPTIDHFQGLVPRRGDMLLYILEKAIIHSENNTINVPLFTRKIFDIYSIEYFLSPHKIEAESEEENNTNLLDLEKTIQPPSKQQELYPIYIYKNPDYFPQIWFAQNYSKAISARDYIMAIGNKKFNHHNTVVATEDIPGINKLKNDETAQNTKANPQVLNKQINQNKISISLKTDQQTLLVVNQSAYPTWQAQLDGEPIKIHPVNLNQQGIVVPRGEHRITIEQDFRYFKVGRTISLITLLMGCAVLILYPNKSLKILPL